MKTGLFTSDDRNIYVQKYKLGKYWSNTKNVVLSKSRLQYFSLIFFKFHCSPIKRLRAMATSERRPPQLPNRKFLLLPQFWLKNRLLLPNRNFSMSNATQCIPYPHQTIILILNAVLKSYYNSLPYYVNYIFNFYFTHKNLKMRLFDIKAVFMLKLLKNKCLSSDKWFFVGKWRIESLRNT